MASCKDCVHDRVCQADGGCLRRDLVSQRTDAESVCDLFADRSLLLELPCRPGTHLWRITTPYRGEPKVTEFVVKNFRTAGKRRQLQIEVQAVNTPGTNWMRYRDFYNSREMAEEALRKEGDGNV